MHTEYDVPIFTRNGHPEYVYSNGMPAISYKKYTDKLANSGYRHIVLDEPRECHHCNSADTGWKCPHCQLEWCEEDYNQLLGGSFYDDRVECEICHSRNVLGIFLVEISTA